MNDEGNFFVVSLLIELKSKKNILLFLPMVIFKLLKMFHYETALLTYR